jgi:transcription antitermination protein NusB
VRGVGEHRADLDERIDAASDNWRVERMPVVDLIVLRMAAWELLHGGDVPVGVAIDEAVDLAKEYSTEDSGGFVNGILSRVVRDAGLAE